jgi:hypothetical protein
MRTSVIPHPPLGGVAPSHKLALGSALAVLGGAAVLLSPMLGWSDLARPWSFLVGFASGLSGGLGVALAVCGLVQYARRSKGDRQH